MEKALTIRLKEAMKERKISFLKLSAMTGIPADRMYKWYQQKTDPKHEDAVILEAWINGDVYPKNIQTEQKEEPQAMTVILKLAESNNNLTQTNLILAKDHDELIQLTREAMRGRANEIEELRANLEKLSRAFEGLHHPENVAVIREPVQDMQLGRKKKEIAKGNVK